MQIVDFLRQIRTTKYVPAIFYPRPGPSGKVIKLISNQINSLAVKLIFSFLKTSNSLEL